jgi:hypothetical protein
MANYDKDMALERIKIKHAKEDIYEDDKEKRESMGTQKQSFAMQFSNKSPVARFKDFDQMDTWDAGSIAMKKGCQISKHSSSNFK